MDIGVPSGHHHGHGVVRDQLVGLGHALEAQSGAHPDEVVRIETSLPVQMLEVVADVRCRVDAWHVPGGQELGFKHVPAECVPTPWDFPFFTAKNGHAAAGLRDQSLAIAPSGCLDDRLQRGHLSEQGREVDVHTCLDQLCAHEIHGLLAVQSPLHCREYFKPVRRAHAR